MSSLTVNVNDQSYTGHQIRPTVKDSNNNTQITAKLGTVNIDLGQFTISYPDSKDANKEVGTGTLTLAPKASNKNFTGSKEVFFKIVGQKIIWSNDVANAFKVYDANGKEVNVSRFYNKYIHIIEVVDYNSHFRIHFVYNNKSYYFKSRNKKLYHSLLRYKFPLNFKITPYVRTEQNTNERLSLDNPKTWERYLLL